MTNREKLNQLSDEKFCEVIDPINCPPKWENGEAIFDGAWRCAGKRYTEENGGCNTCWYDWLREEVL